MSKRKQKSLDEIHYGPEPHAEDTRSKHGCLNWYNYMSDNKSCGEWLSEWMLDRGYEKEHCTGIKKLSYVPRTAAALARMQMRAVPCVFKDNLLDPNTTQFIEKHFNKIIEDIKASKSIQEEERKKKIEYIKIKEWEEKFDKEQKMREEEEKLREERMLRREKENQKRLEIEEKEVKEELANRLKTFDVDKTTKN